MPARRKDLSKQTQRLSFRVLYVSHLCILSLSLSFKFLLNDKVLNFITNEEEYKGAKGKNAHKKQYELSFQENLQSSLIWIMDDL